MSNGVKSGKYGGWLMIFLGSIASSTRVQNPHNQVNENKRRLWII